MLSSSEFYHMVWQVVLNTYLNELITNVRFIYQFTFQGINLQMHGSMYVWVEFQTPGNDIQILFFLLSLSSVLRVPRVGLSMGDISERRERKVEQVQSTDKPFFKFLHLGF